MRRRVTLAFVALFALFLLVFAVLHTPPVRNFARRQAVSWLQTHARIDASFGGLSYNLARLSFDLRDVRLASIETPQVPFFTASRLTVTLDGVPPLRPLGLRTVSVDGADVLVRRDTDGRLNFPPGRQNGSGNPPPVAWTVPQQMDVRRLHFTYRDERRDFTVDVPSASWSARQNLRGLAGAFAANQFVSVAWPSRALTITDLRAHVTWTGNRVTTDAVHAMVRAGAPRIPSGPPDQPRLSAGTAVPALAQFDGALTWDNVFGASSIQSSASGTLSVDALAQWLSVTFDVSGPARWRAEMQGPPSRLVAKSQLESTGLSVRGVPGIRATSAVTADFGRSLLGIDAARLTVGGATIDAAGEFSFGATPADARVTAKWTDLPLATALRALHLTPPAGITGRLRGQTAVQWRYGQPESLTLSFEQDVSPSPRPALATTGHATASASRNRFTLQHTHTLGSLEVQGSAESSVTRLFDGAFPSGPFTAVADDVARAVNELVAAKVLDQGWSERVHGGHASVEGQIGGTLTRPRVTGVMYGRDIRPTEQVSVTIEAPFVFANNRLDFTDARLSQGNNEITVTGVVSLARRTTELDARGTVVDFDGLWRAFDLPAHLRPGGQLGVRAHMAGPLTRPDVDGVVDGSLSVAGLDPGTVSATLTLRDWRLNVADARVSLPAASATGHGSVDFSTPARTFQASTSAAIHRAEDLAVLFPDTEWPLAGTWELSGHVDGRLADVTASDFDATIERVSGSVHQIPLVVDTPAHIERRGDRFTVSPLLASSRSTTISVAGTLGPGAEGLTIAAQADLSDLEPLIAHFQEERLPRLEGTLRVDAQATGSVREPVFEGSVQGTGITASLADWPGVTSLNVDASLRDGLLSMNRLDGQWQDALISADANAPLSLFDRWLPASWVARRPGGNRPAHVNLAITGLTAPALAPFVSASVLANVGGRVSLRLALETARLTREDWRGELVLDEAEVTLAQVPLRQSVPTRFVLRNGRVQVDTWNWEGPGTRVAAVGGINIGASEVRLDAAIDANIDLRMASAFLRPAATGGRADISVSVAGPVQAPIVEGRVAFSDAEFRLPSPRLAASELEGSLLLIGDDIRLEGLRGQLNGGDLTLDGTATLRQGHLDTLSLRLDAQRAAIEYPDGLRSEVVADIQITKTVEEESPLASGTITALRGNYREQFGIVSQLFSGGNRTSISPTSTRVSSSLGPLRLSLDLATLEDIAIETDQGRVEAGASLRVAGTVQDPTVSGRITLRQSGSVFLGGTTYRLESGSVEFRGGTDLRPQLDVTATTQVGTHAIRLEITGPPDQLRTELTSDTGLDRSNIVSLLVTGRTIAEGGLRTEVVGSQVLSYLSGDFLNFAGRALGLDSVRIGRADAFGIGGFDPFQDTRFDDVGGIAGDTDPSSRLTVSKNLTRSVEVLLSQDLSNNGRLTWIATWRPRRTIALRVLSLDDTERVYEFRQERTFGGPPERLETTRQAGPRVVEVTFSGDGFDDRALRDAVRLKAGSRFDFYIWQDDRDRLLRHFHRQAHFEASVTARRRETTEEDGRAAVALSYEVRPGPRSELVVTGVSLPDETLTTMKTEWTRAVFDDFLKDDLARIAEEGLAREGYLQPSIAVAVTATGSSPMDTKTANVTITPGERIAERRIEWLGNEHLDSARLEMLIDSTNLRDRVWREPAAVEAPVRDAYAAEGFLSARVTAGQPVFDGGRANLRVTIVEGPAAQLASATFDGVRGIPVAEVSQAAGLALNERVYPSQLELARRRVEERYLEAGFNEVRVEVNATSRTDGLVDAAVTVEEGPQQILSRVELSGVTRTHPGVVSRALNLELNAPLSTDTLFEARRRLYQTEAFSQVDIDTQPEGVPDTDSTAGVVQQPVVARLSLVERPLWRFRYGLQINDVPEEATDTRRVGPGAAADLERTNLFGRAITIGAAIRAERSRQAVRGYFLAPRLLNLPVTSSFFVQEELEHEGESDTRVTRLSFEQRYRAQETTQLQYGYFYRRARFSTLLDVLGQPFPVDVIVNYAGLYSAVSFDRRDDPFDPQRGWFHSSSLEYAARALGSDLRFIKWVAQQSYLQPIGRGIVLGWSGRLGLAEGFGQALVENERFFAGGGGTVRGYREDSLAPAGSVSESAGGEALLVLNHELRFPIWNRVAGVAFLDAGNAFFSPTRIRAGDLQVGAGLGIRLRTPVGLVRFDFGLPTSQGRGLSGGRWHFAFGQMF